MQQSAYKSKRLVKYYFNIYSATFQVHDNYNFGAHHRHQLPRSTKVQSSRQFPVLPIVTVHCSLNELGADWYRLSVSRNTANQYHKGQRSNVAKTSQFQQSSVYRPVNGKMTSLGRRCLRHQNVVTGPNPSDRLSKLTKYGTVLLNVPERKGRYRHNCNSHNCNY
jgi:hypothetical protein